MKKNLKLAVVGALLVAVLGVCLAGTTFAYFTDADAQGGYYRLGSVDTEIREDNEGWEIKKPSVTNTGDTSCYVRMRYDISQSNLVEVNAPAQGWSASADGWFYYNKALEPGESTTPLFDTVSLADGREADELANLRISLYQEAVQAELNIDGTIYTDAEEIWNLYESGFLTESSSS